MRAAEAEVQAVATALWAVSNVHGMHPAVVRNGPQGRGYSLLPWLVALLLSVRALAYQQEPPVDVDPASGIAIKMQIPFRSQPRSGFFPVHLQITNSTGAAHAWDLRFQVNGPPIGYDYTTSVAVGASQSAEFDLLVPCADLDSATPGPQSIFAMLSGYGVRNGRIMFSQGYPSGSGAGQVGIAEPYGSSIWGSLETRLQDKGSAQPLYSTGLAGTRFEGVGRSNKRSLAGSVLRLDELPPDARVFSGLAALWVGEEEWRGLSLPRRDAIRQWITAGGRLYVAGVSTARLPDLPPFTSEAATLGLGEIRPAKLNISALPIEETAVRVLDLDGAPVPPWREDFGDKWPLRSALGVPRLNVPLLLTFVCLFGILIGPVNLLWLAPPARRYRLFFTVPLLSVGASGLLLALIAFGDGLGGDGVRNVLLFIPAGENRHTLFQEQMVRTRLLWRRAFDLPETVAASYLGDFHNSRTRRYGEAPEVRLSRQGTQLSGDWFRTRALQGLVLRATNPSRGEVVRRPGAEPELLSTLTAMLRQVHYIDAAGECWVADELATGRPTRLLRGTVAEFDQWSGTAAASFF